ncbi:hypothetical protein V6N13_073748 [Hibiscus sabdariffa]
MEQGLKECKGRIFSRHGGNGFAPLLILHCAGDWCCIRLAQAEAVHWTCLEFSREVSVAQTKGLMYLLLITKFFWDIYQDADEDTRRAIQKSFVR